MTDFEIRTATEADVAVILALIKDLAEYERLAHEVVATESGLRDRVRPNVEKEAIRVA